MPKPKRTENSHGKPKPKPIQTEISAGSLSKTYFRLIESEQMREVVVWEE